jgi:hypothetical protein
MTDLSVIGITGSGNIPYAELEALLDDQVPEDNCLILISADNKTGLNEVRQWCREVKQKFMDIADREITTELLGNLLPHNEIELWVLGVRGEESKIRAVQEYDIPVSDLTRAMFSVEPSEVALDGSEINADSLMDTGLGVFMGEGNPPQQRPPQSLLYHGPLGFAHTDKEIEDIVTALIRTHEEKFHGPASGITGTTGPAIGTDEQMKQHAAATALVKYYKNSSGSLRKAGRSKMKAGEEETWLTETQAVAPMGETDHQDG